ncbi:ATP-NAD kinase family protein [Alteromonas oceanisediminis]|uniref:ATP-NAD kinase family protein n=1 Tax=Alteromonas oceanisediminis TaxID=2836180 RepID=UPI001BDA50AB|nr:ATP-NAD kinase family protein [Alteromonas oceanisediminis]MBT0587436.1 ATP-NAD kinase family protein [Alteromonas oceanisediminis]
MQRRFKLGLIVNPFAGLGGATALKGSDGKATRELALKRGAEPQANQKTQRALSEIKPHSEDVTIFTAARNMGETVAQELGFNTRCVYTPSETQTEASDTIATAKALLEERVDIIVFAGGDGTANDVFGVVGNTLPVLGIPAGCKIHSGVYAVSPTTAGKVLDMMIKGELVSVREAEVRDIDEDAFRQGQVIARQVGEMQVPEELRYVQAVKMGGKEVDELVITDIADYVRELMDEHPDTRFVMGSGSTIDGIMQHFGLTNTLLGVDIVQGDRVLAQDVTAAQLMTLVEQHAPIKIVVTLIGGQGHIFGRGNQQLSAEFIQRVGKQNIIVVASKSKLQALSGRPLVVDTGNATVDAMLCGHINIICGYRDHVLYSVTDFVSE